MHITVIIPTHNQRERLRLVLCGLACQTTPQHDFEVLVVDDGCTDGTAEAVEEAQATDEGGPAQVIDEPGLREEYEGDLDLLRELRDAFFEEVPDLIAQLREGIASGDSQAVGAVAHTIKGGTGNFFAVSPFEAAYGLEKIGKGGDLAEAAAACDELERELQRLRDALERVLNG